MLLTDFLTVALIPAIASSNLSEASQTQNRFTLPQVSEESELFRDAFFQGGGAIPENIQQLPQQQQVSDPILREIYEEEKRLDLAGGDENFDGMRSEEARELIRFQRQKAAIKESFRRQQEGILAQLERDRANKILLGGRGRSLQFEGINRAPRENEITTPTPQADTASESTPQPSESTPRIGRLGIGSVFGSVKNKIDNTFGKIFGGSTPTTKPTTTTSTTTPSPPSAANGITFPEDDNPTKPNSSPRPSIVFDDEHSTTAIPNINSTSASATECLDYQTLYNGNCENVLQQLPCDKGQWLIEDDETGQGKCVENRCDGVEENSLKTAFFGGKCVVARMFGPHCAKGMVPYIFKNGVVECDCQEQYLYSQRDGNCYPAYRRGPCRNGEVFASKVTKDGTLPAACVRSKCTQDGFYCPAPSCPKDRNCVKLGSTCESGIWDIHPKELTPFCTGTQPEYNKLPGRIIGNVPTLACAPGSRRDILGTCRKPSTIKFS